MPPMPALDVPPWGAAFAALAVALIAQSTVLHALRFRGGTLSFVLLIVVWFAVRAGTARGAFFGLIAGACEDALAGITGAAWTIATPLAAVLAARTVRGIGSANPLLFAAVVALTSLFRTFACWFVVRAEGLPLGLDLADVHAALWSAALNAIVATVALLAVPALRPLRVDRD
jgi:rod shape-determining protein MreD